MKKTKNTQPTSANLEIRRDSVGKIWSHVRQKWLIETPEERVRQEYVCSLVNEYEYSIEQMEEEMTPPGARGTANARADIVIWRTIGEKKSKENPLIVVECEGDILINRTNSKELVGKCGVFQAEGEYVFASYLIRVRVDNSRVLPEYLAYAINSPLGRQQVDALSRQIIGQANINSQ